MSSSLLDLHGLLGLLRLVLHRRLGLLRIHGPDRPQGPLPMFQLTNGPW